MAGPFLGINMSSLSLRNYQRGIDTIGHNIANVNTRGYSRQVVDYSTLPQLSFYSKGWKSVGQGSILSSINRMRDQYLDASHGNALSQGNKYSATATQLQKIDQIYGEPSDAGINQALDRFFNAWSGAGSNPADAGARLEVRLSGQVLTDRVRNRYRDFNTLESNQVQQIYSTFDQIDGLAERIAQLNAEITRAAAANGTPNDLMDQRDLAVSDLSKLVNVSKEVYPDGSYAIFSAGHTLVQGNAARPFPRTFDPATSTVTDGAITYSVKGGALAGHLAGLNETRIQKANLDSLANTIKSQVNTLHVAGINKLGNTNVQFFDDVLVPPQTGAIDFRLSADVTASADAIAFGISGKEGDGGIATAIAQLRESNQAALGNKSFSAFFSDVVGKLASDTNFALGAAETEESIAAQVESQIQAVSGVSIDDEMAQLMKMQRSYQAAARALTIFDEVTQELINIIR
jgi:flagellar hook-associated protein 1 FlgK